MQLGGRVNGYTVGARIPNIRIPNPFENGKFQISVFERFKFRISNGWVFEPLFENRTIQNGCLAQTILYINIIFIFVQKMTQAKAAILKISDLGWSGPSQIRTFQNGRLSLDRFIHKNNNVFILNNLDQPQFGFRMVGTRTE